MHQFRYTLAVAFEFLESFIPSAIVFELDIQMFGVQPEHRHGGQEFSRESGFILSIGPDRRPLAHRSPTRWQKHNLLLSWNSMTASVKLSFASTVSSSRLRISSLVMDISTLIVQLTDWRTKGKRLLLCGIGLRDAR